MVKQILFYLTVIIIATSCNCQDKSTDQHSHNQLSQEEITNRWQLLFDGKTTDGWRNFKSGSIGDGWQVIDGNLVTLGKGGDLGGDIITDEQFEDFDLTVDWAISPEGNSGIFFNVLEGDYPAVYATGPEYQLIDDEGFPQKLEEWQKTGANYAMHNASNVILKPVGEFNTSRIKVQDGHVIHWLNGNKVLEYDLWTNDWVERVQNSKWKDYPFYGLARKGHISLQDHGSVVKFRNIKIKDLTEKGVPMFSGNDLDGWKIHGTEKWYADNGELICESGPDEEYGYLATIKHYKNFLLRIDFLQEAEGNSGIFFRSSLDGTKISGWQVEVAPPGFDSGGIYESYGRGWLYQIPDERENILKMGAWNHMDILVEGDRVLVWLNNELMTDLTDQKIGEANGSIALQIHSGGGIKVRWRDLLIKEL